MTNLRSALVAVVIMMSVLCGALIAHAQQTGVSDAAKTGIVREDIEWLDVWVPGTHVNNLPRVLLIGDSITRAYYPEVEEKLKGKATVARLATSKCAGDPALVAQVTLLLRQYHFDVIHFNNGMHGWGYSEQTYGKGLRKLIATLRKDAPGAKLIWATTTPVREQGDLAQLSPRTERVKARNTIAAALVAKDKIPVDDLYTLVVDHPEYSRPDGVHSNDKGIAVEAAQVAQHISELLR